MPCPACAGVVRPWRWVRASEPDAGGERFELLRCGRCGTAVTVGAAAPELHESGAYRPGVPRFYRAALPLLRMYDAQRLALLSRLAAPGSRVLDAGAGQGRFVARARAAGYDAFGIEPSARGVARAALIGAPVTQVEIESAAIEAGSLDAVTLWHVLEHVDDPRAVLTVIAGWLRPGGGLLVGVPNLSSLQARVGGARWFHLDVPRHRTHFTADGIWQLLVGSGYEVLDTRHLLLEHNLFGMWQSAVNRLTSQPSYLYNLLKRNARFDARDLAVTLGGLALIPLAAMAEFSAALAKRGGTVAVLARKSI